MRASLPAGALVFESSGYVGTWSVQAAQQAIAADADLLVPLPLLDHPAAVVRTATAYALSATALPVPDGITAAPHARFETEDDPVARASLVLAIGQLAWEDRDAATIARTRTWWQDSARPTDVRISAALAWLCLVDDPIPTDLDALLDTEVTDEIASLLVPVPWLHDVDDDGLRTTLTQMRNPVVRSGAYVTGPPTTHG
ncbi:hypothetical protein [Kitasatospora sp. NPDC093102]|uniref:hypothetical protein n=1 Tax=Kitasatospora sp. NPDC093102 TaxID=3155069 RepID=UPI0034311FB6